MSERQHLEAAIAALEDQRLLLGDAVVDAALAPIREKLAGLVVGMGEERRVRLTVLFADVSGFTALAEQRDPEEVRSLMHRLWQRLDEVLRAHGARIDKHMGDGVMALFGADVARENDPERAVRAALALHEALSEEAMTRDSGNGDSGVPAPPIVAPAAELRLRVGVNTGLVLLGAVGTVGETTALGDTVNVASRLEAAAPVGGVLIAHDTYRHVRGLFDVRDVPPLTLKGKAEPVRAYLVERAKLRQFRPSTRGVAGVETPLVGREAELRRLREIYDEVIEDGGTRAVTVVGDAGVGKSRLLAEFEAWLDLQPRELWYFKGRARQEMQALPYALVRDLLADRFDIAENSSAAAARSRLEDGVRALPGLGPAAMEIVPLLGQLIGLDFADVPAVRAMLGDARALRERAFAAATQFFMTLARRAPVVLLLEDIHWADDSSLNLLAHVTGAGRVAPLLCVFLTRPTLFEHRPLWGEGRDAYQRLDLRPLSRRDTRRLAEKLLARLPERPPNLLELVTGAAEGNPFYVEETVQMLIDDGVLVPGPAVWRVYPERLVGARMPPTLWGVLQARLDALPAAERETLQRASVVGRVFWEEVVAHLDVSEGGFVPDGSPPPAEVVAAIGARLNVLRGKELIYQRESSTVAGTAEYLFKHALLRDVAYESVLRRKRRVYHGAIAAWLEEHVGERADEVAGLIADHYAQAGEAAKAASWSLRAGDAAEAVWAHAEAERYYRAALDLSRGRRDESAAATSLEKLGRVLGMHSRPDEALTALEEAASLYQRLGDREGEGRVAAGIGTALADQGRVTQAIAHMEAMRVALKDGPGTVSARLSYALSAALYGAGRYEEAMEAAARAGHEASAAEDTRLWAAAECYRGDVLMQLCRLSEARDVFATVVPVAESAGDLDSLTHSVHDLAGVALLRGEMAEAETRISQALTLHRRRGVPAMVGAGLVMEGAINFYRGAWRESRASLEHGLAILREVSSPWQAVVGLAWLSQMEVAEGRWEEAIRCAEEAIALGEAGHPLLPMAYKSLAERALGNGDAASAQALLEPLVAGPSVFAGFIVPTLAEAQLTADAAGDAERTILTLLRGMGAGVSLMRVDALRVLGCVRERQRRVTEAARSFGQAVALARAMPYPYAAARTLHAWGCLADGRGDSPHRRERLREALTIAEELGADPLVRLIARDLA